MKTLKQSFMEKVELSPFNGDCWIWTACVVKGYGSIVFSRVARQAHRVSWELFMGDIPDNLFVCHHCDNPPCVNPNHLFLGTAKDNYHDMKNKNRWRMGGLPQLNKLKTHCVRGHLLAGDNLCVYRKSRKCLACRKLRYKHPFYDYIDKKGVGRFYEKEA